MENVRRKNKMIETYSLLLIDMISVLVAYWLALVLRFDLIREAYPKQYHATVGAYILILCLLYTLFLDGNRNFFGRNYWRELYYVVRYTAIIMVGLVVVLYTAPTPPVAITVTRDRNVSTKPVSGLSI